MKTFTIKINDATNVTITMEETFKDLKDKLQNINHVEFDISSMQIKGKPFTENLVVAEYLNIDDKEADEETVEFVLPDLPECGTQTSKNQNSDATLCNELLCRLCGIKTEDSVKMLDSEDINQKIYSFIPVSISKEDQLSKNVCAACVKKLEMIDEFITICKETEKKLLCIARSRGVLVPNDKTGDTESLNEGENSSIEDNMTIYKCPNCNIDLRITTAEERDNLQHKVLQISSVVERISKKSHNLRSTDSDRRITRLGKLLRKSTDAVIEKNFITITEKEDVEEIEDTSTPSKSSGGRIDNDDNISSNNVNSGEKGKMKLRDIRKRMLIGDDVVKARKLESGALENALFSVNSELQISDITGEFVELDTLEENSHENRKKRSKFKCELCEVEFYSQERYLFHVERHDSVNIHEFSCAICKKDFSSENDLWEHREYHLSDIPEGEEAFSSSLDTLQLDNNRKSTKSICEECGARYVLRERYDFHIERHKFGNIKLFVCMICEKRFKSENILWDHYQYQHKSGERFACLTCDKTFVKRANLNYHLKTFGHKGGKVMASQSEIQSTDATDSGVRLSDISKPRPKITCGDCGARFVLQERYEFHMERHKSGKMDVCVCTLCGRESTNENVLWDHYQYMHKRTKRYACTTCGKLFHKQSMLSRHQIKYGHKGAREIDVDTEEGNKITIDSASFKKVIAEEVVEMKSVNCVLCGEVVWGVDPNLINDAVTCASCEGPGLSLQVDSDGAKVISRRQYHCNMCNKHFTTKDRLEYHIMRHSENMDEFICSTCGKELSTEQALFEHYLFVHKGARPHVCELCGKSYQFKARLKEHMRSHSGERPFACEICGQRCMTNNALRSHKKTHITEKRFPCQICKKAFRKRQDLNEHLERHWKNDKTMMFPQVFSCAVCLEMFPTFRVLKKHMKDSHRVESQDPILTDLQPWFECEDCHEKFKHQMSLKVHRERTHEGKMRPVYHCDVCNITYKNARVLSNHIKNKHEGGKRYKCAQCGKEYNQSTSLHNHILLHTGEKPFSCEHCDMTFRTKESRDHHQRKHTGERPYKCPRCDKSFATTTQRREHRKREHDEGNTHSCPECGKICFDEHGVRSHLNTHFNERFKNIVEDDNNQT